MQRRSTTSFADAAKRRQGCFRDISSTVSLEGRSPSDDKGVRNPHLLALGCEKENLYPGIRGADGATGFFSQRRIKWWKLSSGDGKADGPTRDMVSSQVACVNFLLPLAGIHGALTAILRVIDDDVCSIVDIHHEGNTSPVEFEWIGCGRSLEGAGTRGAKATSIDAFLVAKTDAGRRRAYLLEWKYAEPHLSTRSTRPDFKGKGKSGDTRRKRYGGTLPRSILLIRPGSRSRFGRAPLRALLPDHAAKATGRPDGPSARARRR